MRGGIGLAIASALGAAFFISQLLRTTDISFYAEQDPGPAASLRAAVAEKQRQQSAKNELPTSARAGSGAPTPDAGLSDAGEPTESPSR